MTATYSDLELETLMADIESDLVERKAAFDGDAPRAVRQAICAFANDLPDRRRPGVVFIGVRDDGQPTGLEINDALLLKLAHCKTDGNILPLPAMTVGKHTLCGKDVAVVTVAPADSPPVRFQGRIWIRAGPRRGRGHDRVRARRSRELTGCGSMPTSRPGRALRPPRHRPAPA